MHCNAQEQTVTKESFYKALDYLNYKAISLSLEEANTDLFEQFQKDINENDATSQSIVSFLNKNKAPDSTTKLSESISNEKNQYEKYSDIESARVFFTDKIFQENENLKSFETKRLHDTRSDGYADWKKTVVQNIPEILQLDYKVLNMKVEELNNKVRTLEVLLYILTGFIIIALAFVVVRYAKKAISSQPQPIPDSLKSYIKEKIEDAKYTTGDDVHRMIQNTLKNNSKQNKSVVDDSFGKSKSDEVPFHINPPKEEPAPAPPAPKVHEEPQAVFYLSTPNPDGTFNVSSITKQYREGASIYIFYESGNKAEFEIYSDESSIRLALKYPDKNIDPVCDVEGEGYTADVTCVNIIKRGTAELDNNKWKVTGKVRIQYGN